MWAGECYLSDLSQYNADLLWLIIDWKYKLNKFHNVSFQVAAIDTSSLSVLFQTNCIAGTSSPLISLAVKTYSDCSYLVSRPKDSGFESSNDTGNGIISCLTKDAHIGVIDSATGSMISSQLTHPEESTAISLHIFGKYIFKEKKN